MAWLEQHPTSGHFHLCFRFGGKKQRRTLATADRKSAEATRLRFEENLLLLERGRFDLPPDADLMTFLLSDGKLASQPAPAPILALGDVFDRYLAAVGNGSMEANSLEMLELHLRQIRRKFGESFRIQQLTPSNLQEYVNTRVRIKGDKTVPLSPVSLQKEMGAFRACFNWAVQTGLLEGSFPNKGLRFPKGEDKRSFMTWSEIERRINRGGLAPQEIKRLWDCLYLDLDQIDQYLGFVREHGTQPWIYPMSVAAAYTGARRSELCRMFIDDVNFEDKTFVIQERKRVKGQRSFRRVPLAPFLEQTLRQWLANEHPGGNHLFAQSDRSRGTRQSIPISVDDAYWQFTLTTRSSKWQVLRGWHVFRHSFASNLAAKGVDQRFIDEFLGHQTETQRRRYRHLFPDLQRKVLCDVFADATSVTHSKPIRAFEQRIEAETTRFVDVGYVLPAQDSGRQEPGREGSK